MNDVVVISLIYRLPQLRHVSAAFFGFVLVWDHRQWLDFVSMGREI